MNTEDPMFATLQAAYGERIIGFPGTDPTTEVMAKSFYDHLTAQLKELAQSGSTRYPIRASLRVVKVRLWETSSSWAEYFE
jgi:6-pyruvoyltetrahydropterin/6-carboxytetrahydropterin synthase